LRSRPVTVENGEFVHRWENTIARSAGPARSTIAICFHSTRIKPALARMRSARLRTSGTVPSSAASSECVSQDWRTNMSPGAASSSRRASRAHLISLS